MKNNERKQAFKSLSEFEYCLKQFLYHLSFL